MNTDELDTQARVPDLLQREKRKLRPLLKKIGKLVEHDAIIVGVGHRNEFGEVVADRCHCDGVPREFIDNYGQIALHDAAAQLFLSNATSVLAISTLEDYPFRDGSEAANVGAYLRARRVAQLLLSGIDSSRGVAWITLYKTSDLVLKLLDISRTVKADVDAEHRKWALELPSRFTPHDCETASYVIRAGLYEWQMACDFAQSREPTAARYKMIPLTPAELDVAVRAARGYSKQQIKNELDISINTINKHLGAMHAAGFTESTMARRLIGELPERRLRKGKRPGRTPSKVA